jgi:predicted nucleotidyltransferase
MHSIAQAAEREVCLNRVRKMVLGALADVDAEVWLFGSQARGDVWKLSDIDVAIDPVAALPPGVLARLREALEESTIPVRVDVVDLSETDAEFKERVFAEGIRWNASSND